MHDGESQNCENAIQRHGGEANSVISEYRNLTPSQRRQLLIFLESLQPGLFIRLDCHPERSARRLLPTCVLRGTGRARSEGSMDLKHYTL